MTESPWQPTPDGKQLICLRHPDVAPFGRRYTCSGCDSDPGKSLSEPIEPPAAPPPKGCITAEQREQQLTELADYIVEQGKKLCKGKGSIDYARAAKLFEVAIRAHRAAGEYTQTRTRRAHVRWLQAARAKMHGGARGGGN